MTRPAVRSRHSFPSAGPCARVADEHLLPLVELTADASIAHVSQTMRAAGVPAVLVMEEHAPVIVSERDVVDAVAAELSLDTRAGLVGTPHPVAVVIGTPIFDVVMLMLRRGLRHVPVLDHRGRPAGLLELRAGLAAVLSQPLMPSALSALRSAFQLHPVLRPWG